MRALALVALVLLPSQSIAEVESRTPSPPRSLGDSRAQAKASDPHAATSDFDTAASQTVTLPVFFWSARGQCGLGAAGQASARADKAAQRFASLVRGAGSQVAASIGLCGGTAVNFTGTNRLEGWVQVDGSCTRSETGDVVSLALASQWKVLASGGGCLRTEGEPSAFAVARILPPAPVQGCENLCLVAVHAPALGIGAGRDVVKEVCGEAVQSCAVAMGDWSVEVDQVHRLWEDLIDGAPPTVAHIDGQGKDHLASSVVGSGVDGYTAHAFPAQEGVSDQQHKPMSARLLLPGAN